MVKLTSFSKKVKKRNLSFNRILAIIIVVAMQTILLCSCGSDKKNASDSDAKKEKSKMDTSKKVTLTIAGGYTDFKALVNVTQKFNEKYPNCIVNYEPLQDYGDTLKKRLESEDDKIDIFLTDNIQTNSDNYQYALELSSRSEQLDMSNIYQGFIENFTVTETQDTEKDIYSLPMGAELRGLLVNTTILDSLDIEVPTNREEFLAACKKLSDNGYIPTHSNPGVFGQQFIFPYIVHQIKTSDNKEEVYRKINECEEGVSELFREPLEYLYSLVEDNYYNYKYVENEYNMFKDSTSEIIVTSFLNLAKTEDETGYVKVDDIGKVPFMTMPNSMMANLEKTKDDYHSEIEYEFILNPVTDEGGYAHISPAKAFAINNKSDNIDWSLEFLNFFFEEENNKEFCEEQYLIPVTTDMIECAYNMYNISADDVSLPEDVTFEYSFYNLIVGEIVDISKANNPKYMQDDGSGNVTMYDFEHYMQDLEAKFAEQRNINAGIITEETAE